MMVLTKRASDEFTIDKPSRVVVLETTPDRVKFGLLDTGEERAGCKEIFSDPDQYTGRSVWMMAPDGEEIEIDW